MSWRPPTSPSFPYTTLFRSLPLLERTVFLLEMLVPAVLIGWVLRTRRWHEVVFIDALPSPFTRVMALRAAFAAFTVAFVSRSEEHTSELQSLRHLVCRLLLE